MQLLQAELFGLESATKCIVIVVATLLCMEY